MRYIVIVLSLALACTAASAAEVYKWKDKDGRVHYGDRPKGVEAEAVVVESKSGSGEPSKAFADEKSRMAECQAKKSQLENFRAAPSLSEVDNLGKMREYSAAEREQFLAMRQQQVDELCAPPRGPVQPADTFPPKEAPDPKIDLPKEEPPAPG